jgi:hypothetical protein
LNSYFEKFYEIAAEIITMFSGSLLICCLHSETGFGSLKEIALGLQSDNHSLSLALELVFVSQISSDEDCEDLAVIC